MFQRKKIQKENHSRWLRIISAILAVALTAALAGCAAGNQPQSGSSDTTTGKTSSAKAEADGSDLVIPISEISSTAKFYPVTVGGTKMEVLAVKAPDGSIRTAFNTCQVCYDSGRGYYKQSGDVLVCQNCGNRFKMSQVEIESGGCNPWPIFDKNKTVTDESITISYDFLKESKKIFANWKRSY